MNHPLYNIRCFNCGKVWSKEEIGTKRNCPLCGCPFIVARTTGFR